MSSFAIFRGMCKYSNGKCRNERTVKRNGDPHTLCELHRQRACVNQRKLDRKRRDERQGTSEVVQKPKPKQKRKRRSSAVTIPNTIPFPSAESSSIWLNDLPPPATNFLAEMTNIAPITTPSSHQQGEFGFWDSEIGFLVSCFVDNKAIDA